MVYVMTLKELELKSRSLGHDVYRVSDKQINCAKCGGSSKIELVSDDNLDPTAPLLVPCVVRQSWRIPEGRG